MVAIGKGDEQNEDAGEVDGRQEYVWGLIEEKKQARGRQQMVGNEGEHMTHLKEEIRLLSLVLRLRLRIAVRVDA